VTNGSIRSATEAERLEDERRGALAGPELQAWEDEGGAVWRQRAEICSSATPCGSRIVRAKLPYRRSMRYSRSAGG
jgi:hypothetical protein